MDGELLPDKRPETLPVASGASALSILAEMGRGKADADAMAVVADLVWKQEDREADREMSRDFAALQRDLPRFQKTKTVTVATKRGSPYSYNFEPLDRIDPVVKPICHRHNFTYSWTSEPVNGMMAITCVLMHSNGHSRNATFLAPMASGSPTMSEVQKHSSSWAYGERKSLEGVLGIVTEDEDVDGSEHFEYVTDEQAAELADLAEHPDVDVAKFLEWVGAPNYFEIRAGKYETAKMMLKRKRGEA